MVSLSRLTAINAVQLAVAVVSNVFLLLNMARRVKFSIAQPITIIGWYTSSILLISLLAAGAGPLSSAKDHVSEYIIWSQAFYYGLWAAILYFIDASFMAITFWGAWSGHYSKDFNLTSSQRTLMLQTVMFLMYLLLGALVFSKIEGWNYLDAVYWADVSLFTVGTGDFSATKTLSRALLIPYALIGIISLGLVIGSIRSLILERGRRKVDARLEERSRRKTVRRLTSKGKDAILEPIHNEQPPLPDVDEEKPTNEYERRRAEFELMRRIQDRTSTRRRWISMAIATGTWLVLWLLGAYVFQTCEHKYQDWTYFEAVYYAFVSLTTIGYGDPAPISNAGKSFFVFWSLLALPTTTVLISNAGDTVVKFVRDATLRLGNITILPGEDSFMGDVKHTIQQITLGRVFRNYRPPQRESETDLYRTSSGSTDDEEKNLSNDAADLPDETPYQEAEHRGRSAPSQAERRQGSRAPSTFTSHVRRSLSRIRDPMDELPTGTDFHFLLITEIQVVGKHLREKQDHRYSFEQWAWYLKLIGEDERDPGNHRKPRPKEHSDASASGKENHRRTSKDLSGHITTDDGELLKWSWVGHRSPLMGSQEESEWILERLTNRLKESLSAEKRRQINKKPRTQQRIAKRLGYAVETGGSRASGMSEKQCP